MRSLRTGLNLRLKQAAGSRLLGRKMGPRVKAVMPNANKAFGQDVKQEAAEEFLGVEGEGSFPADRVAIPDGEGDRGGTEGNEAMVGDADPMGVVSKVSEEMGGVAERAFGIDDPGFLIKRISEGTPSVRFLKITEATRQDEFSVLAGLDETLEEQMLEALAEHLHGQEVVGTGMDPAPGIGGKSTGGDEAVNVGMMGEVLRPGVQHRGEADLSAKVTRIRSNLQQGLSRGMEEKVIEAFGAGKKEGTEGVRKREYRVEMPGRKHTGKRSLNPLRAFTSLALGAVAIATGVVGNPLRESTGRTQIKMSSESGGPTGTETKQHLTLSKGSSMLADKSIPMLSNDICDFKRGTIVSHLIRLGVMGFLQPN